MGGLINEEGFSFQEIKEMFLNKKNNQLNEPHMIPFSELNDVIWDINVDIFIPCAASRLLKLEHVQRLINSGLTLISSGANVPFADSQIFYGPIAEYVDNNISVIPDFISNCGMARVFAYLMDRRQLELTDVGIFEDCSNTIKNALKECYNNNPKQKNIASGALEIALKKLLITN